MRRFVQWLVSRFIKDHARINDLAVRWQYAALEGWVSIVVNTLLFAVKVVLGLACGSVALIADAVHTLSDSVTSAVIIIGFHMARRPADRQHPFGHGRWEAVATLIVAVLLFAVCVDFMEASFRAIFMPKVAVVPGWLIGVVAVTILIKEILARFAFELGRMLAAPALLADAAHHRSDVWATAMVAAGLLAARFDLMRWDGVMGIGVCLVIIHTAWRLLWQAITPLLGEAPDPALTRQIEALAHAQPAVQSVHDVIVHQYGQQRLISLHLEIDDKMSAVEAHAVAEDVEDRLAGALGAVVVAHVDPVNKNHPAYAKIAEVLQKIVDETPILKSWHDLRVIGRSPRRCKVVCDLLFAKPLLPGDEAEVLANVRAQFQKIFPEMRLVLKSDLQYSFPE